MKELATRSIGTGAKGGLSNGDRRKLAIACMLLYDLPSPSVWFVKNRMYVIEEPLADLDSVAIQDVLITLTYLVVLCCQRIKLEKPRSLCDLLHAHASFLFSRLLRSRFVARPGQRGLFRLSLRTAELLFRLHTIGSLSLGYADLRNHAAVLLFCLWFAVLSTPTRSGSCRTDFEIRVRSWPLHLSLGRRLCVLRIETLLTWETTHLNPSLWPNSSSSPKSS